MAPPCRMSPNECDCVDCVERLRLIAQMYKEAEALSRRQKQDQIFTAADLDTMVY